jgi:signal transduction histidine kinase
LAALRGELELALRHPRSEQAYRAAITEALDDTNRLIALAEDLLTLARLEVAGVEAAQTQESLPQLIQEASRLSLLSTKSEVRVTQEVPEMQVRVRARDFSRLLRNLIDNALAHAPPGSEIAVRAKQESGRVIITVRDHGIGIRPELRERIFEPFFRGDVEREHSGAGLGLAIAREIARAHGGQLSVQDCDGQGACFALELPQSAAPAPISTPDLTKRP